MTTGHKIRKLRQARSWTQAQLGERAGIDIHNVTRYENDRTRPRAKVLQRFADALQVPVEELAPDDIEVTAVALRDPELLAQFQAVERLNEADKAALKRIIQAVIVKNQVQDLTRSA